MTSSDGLRVRCEARSVLYGLMIDRPKKKREREMDVRGRRKAKKIFLFLQCSISLFFFPPLWTVWCSVKAHLQTDTHDSARCTPPGPRWLHSWVLTVRQPRPQKATITIYSAAAATATATLEGLYLSREREEGARQKGHPLMPLSGWGVPVDTPCVSSSFTFRPATRQ